MFCIYFRNVVQFVFKNRTGIPANLIDKPFAKVWKEISSCPGQYISMKDIIATPPQMALIMMVDEDHVGPACQVY